MLVYMDEIAPYEKEFKEFARLVENRGTLSNAYTLLEKQPNLCFWMNMADVAWNVSWALRLGMEEPKASKLQDYSVQAIERSDSLYSTQRLDAIVRRFDPVEVDDPDIDARFNEFLHHIQKDKAKHAYEVFDELPAISECIPIGLALHAYGKFLNNDSIGHKKATNFQRKMIHEFKENCGLVISTNLLIEISTEYEASKELPLNIRKLLE